MEKHLALFLRLTGAVLLLALPAVFLPYAWMDAIHRGFGMGSLPELPVVSYLTRSVSLLYALLGAAYWHFASDVRRYLPLLRFVNALLVVFTAAMIAIDVASDVPAWWTATEGV